ncbi:MAG: DMT family transporter [Bacteroidetes bacterium]|nr:DMT family transporter [Bacteroidota bacterium]MDA1120789.1 DMT family transporter [Bacteroidota bacterium]
MRFSRGVYHMLISTVLFQFMNVCVKLLPNIPSIEIIVFRSLVSLIICLVSLKSQRISIWGNNKKLLLFRGSTGAVALILYFRLIQEIPLANAVILQYLAPIFVTLIGIVMVNEAVKPIQWLFFLISFSGIVIVQGFDIRIEFSHILIGATASFFSGLAYNSIRKMKTTEHPLVIIFYFPLVTLPFAGTYSAFNWVTPNGWEWLYLLLVGLFTQFAQYFMTKSLQSEELSKVSIINYLGIIFALIFGFAFGETFNLMTYLGMATVILGVLLNIFYKKKGP